MEASVKAGPRWRTHCGCVVQDLFLTALTLMVVVAGVGGRTLSRDISLPDENYKSSVMSKSREITLSDEMSRRCRPVPHDVLWLRLNIASRLGSNSDTPPTSPPSSYLFSADQQPEVDIDFRSGDRRRHRRDTREDGRRRQRRKQRRQERRQTKRLLRQSHKLSRQRDLLAKLSDGEAWQCHMTSHWLRMPDDVFPPYIHTGNCTQSHCMMGLYECRARKYATHILRRVPGRCNPLPVTGDVTEGAGFEEAWLVEEYHVVVGCECSKRRTSGWYDGLVPA